ncbi:MAG: hypothetical protein QM724_01175 [Flavobacteriales bacterium]
MKTTRKSAKRRGPAHKRKKTGIRSRSAARSEEHVLEEKPEEGAGNNEEGAGNMDERELPEKLRDTPATETPYKRPPTNAIPDGPQDPASPAYKEPHPKDRIVNN